MSYLTVRQSEVAKRYGGVLFDLAQENRAVDRVLKDIRHLHACVVRDPKAWTYVASPVISLELQRRILQKLAQALKLDKLLTRFLLVVKEHHRLKELPQMLDNFMARHQEALGIEEGVIETSIPLSPQSVKSLQKVLSEHFEKEVVLKPSLNQDLLGGAVIRFGTRMIDGSVRTQLAHLKQMMKG